MSNSGFPVYYRGHVIHCETLEESLALMHKRVARQAETLGPRILKLLAQGNSPRETARICDCSSGYVYTVRKRRRALLLAEQTAAWEDAEREAGGTPHYTCPRCMRVSYNPNDIENAYCGGCHEFDEGQRERAREELEAL